MSVPAALPAGNVPAPRRERIGSGDIASILGLPDAFGSPYSVWIAKTTGEEPEPDERTLARFWWGDRLEPAILERYAVLSPGHKPVPGSRQKHFIDPEYPFLTATVDDIFEKDGVTYITEAKMSNFDLSDGLPHRVQAQIQWQMGISRIYYGVAAVLFVNDIGRDVQIWDVDFDGDVFGKIKDAVLNFYFSHVLTREPPEIDGHRATTAALKRIKGVDTVADITHLADIVERLGQTKAAKKSIEGTEAALTNKIKAELGQASLGKIDGKDAVTWRTSKSGSRSFLIKKAFLPKGSDDE
jgi:predicted phage-related endonuclease